MSPAAAAVRYALFLQAGLTLLFGLLRPGASTSWTVVTVAVAMGAVGLAAALTPTKTMRTAVLGFEGFAVAFGVLGLAAGHYVPGTVIAVHLLVKLARTSVHDFVDEPVAAVPLAASLPAAAAAQPPVPASVPGAPPAPWPGPVAAPVLAAVSAVADPAPAPAVPFAAPFGAPGAAPWPTSAPFLPPQPGAHPAGRTVVPLVPQQAAPPVAAAPPVTAAPPAEVSASTLEEAVRALGEVTAPVLPVAPVPTPKPAPPTAAPACMTILPR